MEFWILQVQGGAPPFFRYNGYEKVAFVMHFYFLYAICRTQCKGAVVLNLYVEKRWPSEGFEKVLWNNKSKLQSSYSATFSAHFVMWFLKSTFLQVNSKGELFLL